MNATDSWTRVTLMGLLHVVKSCGHPSHGSCCVHCGTWETYLHNQLCPVKVAERCADLNFSNQDRKVVLTPDVNGVSPDAVSGPERKRPDNTAHSSDCCSGFVTQEGRDIHQAIEHEPQNPDSSEQSK